MNLVDEVQQDEGGIEAAGHTLRLGVGRRCAQEEAPLHERHRHAHQVAHRRFVALAGTTLA